MRIPWSSNPTNPCPNVRQKRFHDFPWFFPTDPFKIFCNLQWSGTVILLNITNNHFYSVIHVFTFIFWPGSYTYINIYILTCRPNIYNNFWIIKWQFYYDHICRSELMQIAQKGSFATVWQIHGLAGVVGCKIKVLYPTFGGHSVRKHHDRICHPRNCTCEYTANPLNFAIQLFR